MQPDGIGALYLAFEQLKRKLSAEGLFDPERKKPLPCYPRRVGVITSATGAALRDILNISKRRFPLAQVILFPSLVQGVDAPDQLRAGIEIFDGTGAVDVIIIGRGGGSLEDLYAFNDEALARTIANCRIPVISAVGHETDFTICDFVADMRAPTPSAAAELAFPDAAVVRRRLSELWRAADSSLESRLDAAKKRIEALLASHALSSPLNYIEDKRMALAYLSDKLDMCADRMISERKRAYAALLGKLEALSPLAVLSRGYAIATRADGEASVTLGSVSDVSVGDRIRIRLSDGQLDADVAGVVHE
jgi:exodeoxyribonuclease VII large subunit